MNPPNVVTRFAPSPTGALHVGGARTALFAWAYARGRGGRFVLRLEDTDRARSSPESTQGILRDLAWLGLDWDEGPRTDAGDPYEAAGQMGEHGPYFQSQRLALYREHVERLLAAGRAYEDAGAVRFRMGEDVAFEDAVYGPIEVKGAELEDFVILKSDGFPTYHLAVVVDDALMGVTHVLRGQEHLYNTPKHVALQDALGVPRPTFAHLPSILNPDGSKMSKRDKAKAARKAALDAGLSAKELAAQGAGEEARLEDFLEKRSDDVAVAERIAQTLGVPLPEIEVADFRRSGYLPETLLNYLALLGWSPGGDRERFDLAFLVEHFDFEGVGRKNARFDRAKLFRFDGDDLAAMEPATFEGLWRAHCEAFEPAYVESLAPPAFSRLAAAYRPRSRTLQEPCDLARFFLARDEEISYDAKAVKKWLRKNEDDGVAVLREIGPRLAALEAFTPETIEAELAAFAEATGRGLGKVAQPLRVAVSGAAVSPGIGDTLAILGREHVTARIARCLAQTGG
ncbi:MAG: glutamate--tRNA ligase [Planctomycetota bacterium]